MGKSWCGGDVITGLLLHVILIELSNLEGCLKENPLAVKLLEYRLYMNIKITCIKLRMSFILFFFVETRDLGTNIKYFLNRDLHWRYLPKFDLNIVL